MFRKNALGKNNRHVDNDSQSIVSTNTIANEDPIAPSTGKTAIGTNIVSANQNFDSHMPSIAEGFPDTYTVREAEPETTKASATDYTKTSPEYQTAHLTGRWMDEYGFIHHAKLPMPKELAKPSDIPFIRSMQGAVIDNFSKGYTYRSEDAMLNDLRELSRSVCYAQEQGYTSVKDIENAYLDQLSSLKQSYCNLADIQDHIDLINEKIHFVGVYRSTSKIYKQYRILPAKAKESFRNKHYKALNAHDQAYRFLASHGHPDKLPSVHALKAYKNEQLIPARDKYNNDYVNARQKLNEIEKIRKNIYPLFSNNLERNTTKIHITEHSR